MEHQQAKAILRAISDGYRWQLPPMSADIIESVNDYMDEYKAKKDKISMKSTLVGQIHKGEQLLLDHKDERMVGDQDSDALQRHDLFCNLCLS